MWRTRARIGIAAPVILSFALSLWFASAALASNSRIVYLNNLTLWSANSSTGESRERITETGSENRILSADLSPSGTTAVVSGFFKGVGGLSLVNMQTHVRTQLYTGKTSFPKFSPDGKKVIFTLEENIAIINTDGTGLTTLIGWKGNQVSPDISPDGTKIVFVSPTESKGKSVGNAQVFIANANGSSPVQLTHTAGGTGYPAFSPDGTKISYSSFGTGSSLVYTMSTTGANQTQITQAGGGDASWSPDGKTLLFGTERNKVNFGFDLWTVNSTGGNEQPFITGPDSENIEAGWYVHPSLAAWFMPILDFSL